MGAEILTGVEVVCIVDAEERRVSVYRSLTRVTELTEKDTLVF